MDLEEDRLRGWELDTTGTSLCPVVGSISSVLHLGSIATVLKCLVT